jgi:Ca2+-binding EF-hand superfamily protein
MLAKGAGHHAQRKTAVAQSFQNGFVLNRHTLSTFLIFVARSHNLLDLQQDGDERKNSFLENAHHQGDFISAIKESQGDTISTRISSVTGSLPGSKGFIEAKLAVGKFLKIFPGQEEIGSLTETFQLMTGVAGDNFFHGTLTPINLQNAIQLKGLEFTDKELALVFPILDIDGDGSVDLDEFTHFGMAATITAQRISSGVGAKPGTDVYNEAKIAVEKVLRLIPQHVLTYYSGKGELDELKKWLEDIDADGDGSIDPDELKIAMTRFGKSAVFLKLFSCDDS